ncbi:MAG: hypothetical protein KAV25_05795, partial [Methanophagales archaeon]|nr:hypothetical protein [Methanophagales archaeon]
MQRNRFVEGDRIRIKKKSDSGVVVYEGVVMPTASRNVVIKLDSGYNIGIRQESTEIEVISRAEALKGERREEKELRKVKVGLPTLSILSTG